MELISVKEVAKEIGCSYEVVREAIRNGSLPIGFVGQVKGKCRIIIPKSKWEAWKNSQLYYQT